MNQIVIKGRLTKDPEIRKTNSDKKVASFSVAVNRRFDRDTTDFINCEAWGKTAELLEKFFHKGQEIMICGELHLDNFKDKNGNSRTTAKVVADQVEFCGTRQVEGTTAPASAPTPAAELNLDGFEVVGDLEGCPF